MNTSTELEYIKLSSTIAIEVCNLDLSKPLDTSIMQKLNQLWLDNIVLLFRNQSLTQEDLVRVTGTFGKIGKPSRPRNEFPKGYPLHPNIMLISNIREKGESIGALPDGEMMFHHDMLHAEIPHKGTMLYSVEVPSHGGETLFANGYVAYEALPDNIRKPLEGRMASHHYNYGSVQKGDQRGTKAFSESCHPVFRTHEDTGRKAIYVNRLMTQSIVDMDHEESERLLNAVYDHSENPDFIYKHFWQTGDLLLWDNRCSMHARTDFPADERRLMWRTTLEGEAKPR